jgi:hypothetical protein
MDRQIEFVHDGVIIRIHLTNPNPIKNRMNLRFLTTFQVYNFPAFQVSGNYRQPIMEVFFSLIFSFSFFRECRWVPGMGTSLDRTGIIGQQPPLPIQCLKEFSAYHPVRILTALRDVGDTPSPFRYLCLSENKIFVMVS